MTIAMQKFTQHGFTLIEIISVLIIIGIIALSITAQTDTFSNFRLESQIETIKTHIRYAQTLSMYSQDSYGLAIITQNSYQLVKNSVANPITIPGEESDTVILNDTLIQSAISEIYFDALGRPKQSNGSLISNDLIMTLTYDSINRTITITKNTGYVP